MHMCREQESFHSFTLTTLANILANREFLADCYLLLVSSSGLFSETVL